MLNEDREFLSFFELLSSSVTIHFQTVTRLSLVLLTNNSIPPRIKSVLESMDESLKNKIFQARGLCLRSLDTNSICVKSVRRNEWKG